MDDIRSQDRKVFFRELLAIPRVAIVLCAVVLIGAVFRVDEGNFYSFVRAVPVWFLVIGTATVTAYNASLDKRFVNRRYQALWRGCQDRLARFNEVLKRLRKDQLADLREMPNTIRKVAESLYVALRKA